ncbi:MAG: hypothetical protein OXL96_00540, partial [Candidatus Poribacteria bacterium]|nr:hypothetical protein [Candidatus Poribacteria bacterium]
VASALSAINEQDNNECVRLAPSATTPSSIHLLTPHYTQETENEKIDEKNRLTNGGFSDPPSGTVTPHLVCGLAGSAGWNVRVHLTAS